MRDWGTIEATDLKDFQKLLTGRCGGIVIYNFLTEEECGKITSNASKMDFSNSYNATNTAASYHGQAAVELRFKKEEYFRLIKAETEKKKKLLKGVHEDPLELVIRTLSECWPPGATVAMEEDQSYFAGIIRSFKKGVIHNDWAPRAMQGWSIANISQQLSWNIYLSESEGGELEVWNRKWIPSDESTFKNEGENLKGYAENVVDGCDSFKFKPKLGSFVIFDATNYHTVHEVYGTSPRYSMSSFVGITDPRSPLILWS